MTDKPPCEEAMTDLTDEAVKALLDALAHRAAAKAVAG